MKTPHVGDTADTERKICPICRRVAVPRYNPFCSSRCADVDLHRWLGGVYAIPSTDPTDDEAVDTSTEEQT